MQYRTVSKIIYGILFFLATSCAVKDSRDLNKKQGDRFPSSTTEALIRYEFKEGELTSLCQEALNALRADMAGWRTHFQTQKGNVLGLLEFEEIQAKNQNILTPLIFMASVSTEKKIRDESSQCEEVATAAFNEITTNRENYLILNAIKVAEGEDQRLLKETLSGFEMNGMQLSDENLATFKKLKDRLSQLSVQFGQNLNNDVSTVSFSAKELSGAKSDFLARLKKDPQGQYIVTTKEPDYIAVMENVSVADSRKKMLLAFQNRQAKTNTPLLQEAIKIRAEMAHLMGFATYADYALKEKMAGDSQTVFKFINDLKNKLGSKNKSDLKNLAKFKKEELKDNSPLKEWDIGYLSNLLKIKKYNLDDEEIRQYFPSQFVVEQILDIYSSLLGVDFKQIKGAKVWADTVQLYEVRDHASQEIISYFYADLIPRDGKYGHAAAFNLINRKPLAADFSVYQKPISSIVANFTPAAPGKPALLSHEEVETFFHEFGHIMHQVLTKTKFSSLSGSNVKGDFVEAPSQMLENWVWQKEVLKKMSQHYHDSNKKMPDELIAKLQSVRMFNSGRRYTRQLVFGLFDMNIHTHPELDVTQEFQKVYRQLSGLAALKGGHFPATFGHMMGGYSAGYYGYLWSKVYAEDMFSVFAEKGVLSAEVGKKYRTSILELGNSKEPLDLVKAFLGREPNNKAFFKSLGL